MDQLVLDLCSGIGGFTLAGLISGGFETIAFCEINPYCQQVLNLRFENIPVIPDLKDVTANSLRHLGIHHIDGITAGLPCPAFSFAGKQLGSQDSRNLFPEFFRILRDLRPRWAIVENVPGLLTTESGRFFAGVLRDFAECGYDAQWSIISAASVGSVHRRDLLWIIAHTSAEGCRQGQGSSITTVNNLTSHSDGWKQWEFHRHGNHAQKRSDPTPVGGTNSNPDREAYKHKSQLLPQSNVCISHDGVCPSLDGYLLRHGNLEEWLVAATIPKFNRLSADEVGALTSEEQAEYRELWKEYQAIRRQHKEQLKALGNAIVPQCAAVVFDRLKAILNLI